MQCPTGVLVTLEYMWVYRDLYTCGHKSFVSVSRTYRGSLARHHS
jgi:hypothetical protein